MKTKEYLFNIEGGFDIDKKFKPEVAYSGNIIAFNSKKIRVSLLMALEVEDKDGNVTIITKEAEMQKLGFTNLDYKHLVFNKID